MFTSGTFAAKKLLNSFKRTLAAQKLPWGYLSTWPQTKTSDCEMQTSVKLWPWTGWTTSKVKKRRKRQICLKTICATFPLSFFLKHCHGVPFNPNHEFLAQSGEFRALRCETSVPQRLLTFSTHEHHLGNFGCIFYSGTRLHLRWKWRHMKEQLNKEFFLKIWKETSVDSFFREVLTREVSCETYIRIFSKLVWCS